MYFDATYGHPHGSSAQMLGIVKCSTSFNGVTGSGGRLLSCSWISRKGKEPDYFLGMFIKLMGKEQRENPAAFRGGGCSCFTSFVPAPPVPQPRWSPQFHQTSKILCLHLAAPAPQNCSRTFPHLKIPAQPLPTPVNSSSILQFSHPSPYSSLPKVSNPA